VSTPDDKSLLGKALAGCGALMLTAMLGIFLCQFEASPYWVMVVSGLCAAVVVLIWRR
jgi:hypothetical protein